MMELLIVLSILLSFCVGAALLWLFNDDEDAGYEQGVTYEWDWSHLDDLHVPTSRRVVKNVSGLEGEEV